MRPSSLAGARVMAWLLDAAICIGLGSLFGALGWVASTGYWLFRDGLFEGQSVGKRLMGVRVVRKDGGPCTAVDALVRNILWVIPVMNLLMGLSGLRAVFNRPDGRHWGDRLAETRVKRA